MRERENDNITDDDGGDDAQIGQIPMKDRSVADIADIGLDIGGDEDDEDDEEEDEEDDDDGGGNDDDAPAMIIVFPSVQLTH